ncbi:MAG: hypothetical protein JSV52_01980 [Candidatus Zixiibacteriota bacterium]|nr:MAG: hypothetical protein JSV52_01980 [candidate division Zixibacteria bacterium]
MKKLLNMVLVAILVASFVFTVMATDSQAKVGGGCHYECQGIYWMECCPPGGQTSPDKGGIPCVWTGAYCA